MALLSSWVMSAHRTTSLAEGREGEIGAGERDSGGRERDALAYEALSVGLILSAGARVSVENE